MKKRNKLLAIAVLTLFAVCFSAMASIFALANTDASGNIATWGDAESGNYKTLTAVTTEKYEGEKSFEIASSTGNIRTTSPAVDGTFYTLSLKVKAAAASTTFKVTAIGTHTKTESGYAYTYTYGPEATLATEWTDYSITFGYRYVADETAVYYTEDGKTETKTADIKKALAGFDLKFTVSAKVYVDNLAITPTVVEEEGEEDEEGDDVVDEANVIYSSGFEDNAHGFGVGATSGYSNASIVTKTEDANGVYSGERALKVNGYSRNNVLNADNSWIAVGDLFTLNVKVKRASGTSTTAGIQMVLWSCDANGANWAADINLTVMPTTALTTDEWVNCSFTFGIYGNGEKVYAYQNGTLSELSPANKCIVAKQNRFDLVAKNGSVYFDDLQVIRRAVSKDATLTVVDEDGNTVSGAELTVADENGTALEVQPEITEAEGVYTVKALAYSNFTQKYKIVAGEANCTVDLVNSTGELTVAVEEEEDEDYSDAFFFADFEDGTEGFENSGGSFVVEEGAGYKGTNALKVNGIWTRKNLDGEWIQQGDFYEFSAWTKVAAGNPQACAQMYIWGIGPEPENKWVMCNTRIHALGYTSISEEYTKVKGVFGVYSDGTTAYAYHNGGKLEELSELANHIIAYYVRFDLGATNGGSVYYDNVALTKTTVRKDAVVTVYGAEGAELIVADENGVALETQPKVVEENGVYTIKNLEFSNFAQKYVIKVVCDGEEFGTAEVDFVNNSATVANAFNGTVTVKDAEGNAITDATITYGDAAVTENVEGVYTLENLLSSVEVIVESEGLLRQYATITPDSSDVTVVLKPEVPTVVVEGNKVAEGDFENGFTLFTSKQGVDAAITDKEQYTGKKSWALTSTKEGGRLLSRPSGIDTDGTTYYLEAMVKSANGANFSLGIIATGYDSNGAYCYPSVNGETIALTEEWVKVSISFSFRHDATTNKIYTTINGGEEVEFSGTFASLAAADMVFNVSNGGVAYVDDIVLLETYTGSIRVNDAEGNAIEGATFEITDFAGRTYAGAPTYDAETGKYIFENLAGTTKIVTTAGGKTYSAVTLSKTLNDVLVESSYTITVTLQDQNGDAVIGANVIARKGVTNVGTFTDNGDGTYTLAEAMGSVSIVVMIDGYDFTRTDNVTAENSVLTIVGEKYEAPVDSDTASSGEGDNQGSESVGCFASVGGAMALVIPAMLAFGVAILRKKED